MLLCFKTEKRHRKAEEARAELSVRIEVDCVTISAAIRSVLVTESACLRSTEAVSGCEISEIDMIPALGRDGGWTMQPKIRTGAQ